MKWEHIFISNAKRNLLSNYHKIKGKYLQICLNEFTYRLKWRCFGKKYLKDLLLLILHDYELSGHSIYYLSNSYENFPITINIP